LIILYKQLIHLFLFLIAGMLITSISSDADPDPNPGGPGSLALKTPKLKNLFKIKIVRIGQAH
jgi:hypothetical protein